MKGREGGGREGARASKEGEEKERTKGRFCITMGKKTLFTVFVWVWRIEPRSARAYTSPVWPDALPGADPVFALQLGNGKE